MGRWVSEERCDRASTIALTSLLQYALDDHHKPIIQLAPDDNATPNALKADENSDNYGEHTVSVYR